MSPGVVALVLLAALLHASWNLVLRRGKDRLWSAMAMSFSSALACLLVIPFLPLPNRASWPCIVLSAVIHVVYQLLLVRMYREGEFGVTYPVARGSSPLLISIGGAILTTEYLAPTHILGVLLVSAGIITLAMGGHHLHRQSVLAALATGTSIAAYSLTDGFGGRQAGSAVSYTVWLTLLCGLTMPWAALWVQKGNGEFRMFRGRSRTDYFQALGGGLVSALGYGIVIWAMQRAPMGVVSALRETSVLFAVILGRTFLGESFTPRKMWSAVLIFTGVLCLR